MKRLAEYLAQSPYVADTLRNKKTRLTHAFAFFSKLIPSGNFFQITPEQFLQYFGVVNQMKVTKKTKQRYREALFDYAIFLCKPLLARNKRTPSDYNLIFSDKYYKFQSYSYLQNDFYIEMPEALEILRWAKFSKTPLVYFSIIIQMTTGCRVKGLLGLTRNDINFEQRTLIMHEKKQDSLYFLGPNVIKPLQHYLSYLPPQQQRVFKISEQHYNKNLKDFNENLHSNALRDFLNSHWETMGVDEGVRDILQNRTPHSVNAKSYMKKYRDWKKRLAKYDEIYPFRSVNF